MAITHELTDGQKTEWENWVDTRPPAIQEMCRKWPPNVLYRMESGSGHRATVHAYNEDGTVTMFVSGEYNRVIFSRAVFGVDPETLVECDLPDPREDVGDTSEEAGFSQGDITDILIPKIKEMRNAGNN